MRRRLVHLAAAAWLLLSVATVALWVRSYQAWDTFGFELRSWTDADHPRLRSAGISTLRGSCQFYLVDNDFDLRYPREVVSNWSDDDVLRFRRTEVAGVRFAHRSMEMSEFPAPPQSHPWWKPSLEMSTRTTRARSDVQRALRVPLWMLLAVLQLGPLAALAVAARRRARAGRCPACGYDLRATPGRCPECGATAQPPHNQPMQRTATASSGAVK